MNSIIIPCKNNAEITRECLKSIEKHTTDYELILIDQDSKDDTQKVFSSFKAKVITNRPEKTLTEAWNQGIEKASGEYLIFMNNDILVAKGWLDKMLGTMERFPHIWCLCPSFLQGIRKGSFKQLAGYRLRDQLQIVPARIFGACFMVRRDVFNEVEKFDERFKLWYQDIDFEIRLMLKQHPVHSINQVLVYHYHRLTCNQEPRFKEITQADYLKFKEKYSEHSVHS